MTRTVPGNTVAADRFYRIAAAIAYQDHVYGSAAVRVRKQIGVYGPSGRRYGSVVSPDRTT
jgi:hypothetical protein